MNSSKYTFKLVLIGDGGVGKSTFIKRHLTGDFTEAHVATLGVEVHPLEFRTNYGMVVFNVWDCAGVEKFSGLKEGYYIGADCAIVMFDMSSKSTLEHVPDWIEKLQAIQPTIPITIAGTKTDLGHLEVISKDMTDLQALYDNKYPVERVSAKSNYHFELPFLTLARKLISEDLEIVPEPPCARM